MKALITLLLALGSVIAFFGIRAEDAEAASVRSATTFLVLVAVLVLTGVFL